MSARAPRTYRESLGIKICVHLISLSELYIFGHVVHTFFILLALVELTHCRACALVPLSLSNVPPTLGRMLVIFSANNMWFVPQKLMLNIKLSTVTNTPDPKSDPSPYHDASYVLRTRERFVKKRVLKKEEGFEFTMSSICSAPRGRSYPIPWPAPRPSPRPSS